MKKIFINNTNKDIKQNFIIIFIKLIEDINTIDILIIKNNKEEIITLLKEDQFNPKNESTSYVSFFFNKRHIHLFIIGINFTQNSFEKFKNNIGQAISVAQNKKAKEAIFITENIDFTDINQINLGQIIQSTVLLRTYQFNTYITNTKKHIHQNIEFSIQSNPEYYEQIQKGIEEGYVIGQAINFSRNLSDTPAKDMYPEKFVETVLSKIEEKKIDCQKTIMNMDEMIQKNMGGIVGVGQGSHHKPKLLILKYTPHQHDQNTKKIALVGKGVTFDTGGISIKPSEGMEDMKADMSGAAAVMGAFIGLCQLNSPHIIYAVAPLAENMVDGNSIRPGDILQFYNGKTAEVKNTDAEGRLILADALSYISELASPDIMIDLATLTGACRIALGPVYAGLMSENQELKIKIEKAGTITGDQCWPLPLEEAYKSNMHSDVADMCNIGTKGYKAGATMGGMFLREFVKTEISWAHIDIATVATDCPIKKYILPYGATGFGVNLLIELFKNKKYFN